MEYYKEGKGIIQLGDCLDLMKEIPDGSIDLILADLPYGKTKNPWDIIIDPVKLWKEYWRITKPNAAIFLFGQDKFTAMMMLSDPNHRYNLIWEKTSATGHLNSNNQPMRCHEDMMLFYRKQPTYNPQKTTGHPRKVSTAHHKRNSKKTTNYNEHGLTGYDSTERFPRSVWKYKTDKQIKAFHSTQKPVALIEEAVKTYSNEGDIVLDNVAGSGTTGKGCENTNRFYILIEKELESFEIMKNRLNFN